MGVYVSTFGSLVDNDIFLIYMTSAFFILLLGLIDAAAYDSDQVAHGHTAAAVDAQCAQGGEARALKHAQLDRLLRAPEA